MNRRVEFSLNMDNPQEAALYDALADLLRHRRAGEVIRQALVSYLFRDTHPAPGRTISSMPRPDKRTGKSPNISSPAEPEATSRIVEQSAEMFGF